VLADEAGDVRSLAFSHDGAHLVTGAADGAVCLWETGSARPVDCARGHHITAVRAIATGGDARRSWLLTADQTSGLRQWRIRPVGAADLPALLAAGTVPQSAVFAAGPDEDLELVRLATGGRLRTLHGERPVAAVGFASGDAYLVATAEPTGAVTIRDAVTGMFVHATMTRPELHALACFGHRGTAVIVTGHAGGTVLCTMPDGRQAATTLPAGRVDRLVAMAGDRPAVIAFGGRTCTVIDPHTGTVLRTASLSLLREVVDAVRSPSDPATEVLACHADGVVYRIDVDGPLVTGVLAGPAGIDRLAALRTVVAGIETGSRESGATLRTWDPETGQSLGRFRLPGPVRAMTAAGDDLVVWHGAALTRLTWRPATR
jgi:WD40 repeat protein